MGAKDVENKVEALEKQLSEMESAIRRMAQENNDLVAMVSKVVAESSATKSTVEALRKELEKRAKKEALLGRTNY